MAGPGGARLHTDGGSGRVDRVSVPVDAGVPGGTTNAYLLDGLLVDPAARTDALDAAVDAADPPVAAVAVTHAHPDHAGAVAAYAASTGATVVARAGHADRFAEATGVAPDETVVPGETVGDTAVRVVDTPGHAPDHVGFAAPSRASAPSALCCGDLAVGTGSVAVAAPDGDLDAYLASLRRVRDAGYDRLLPGHGPPISDPRATCDRLIERRLARERDVLAAVEAGATDVAAVVDAAYERDVSGVRDLARATVAAHVRKLVDEGRVGEAWTERLAAAGFE